MGRVLLIEEMLYAIMNDLNFFYERYKLIRARGTLFSSLYTDCNPQLMLGDMVNHPFLLRSDLRDLHLSSGRCTVWYISNSKCNRVIDVHELEVVILLVFNYSDPIMILESPSLCVPLTCWVRHCDHIWSLKCPWVPYWHLFHQSWTCDIPIAPCSSISWP